MDEPAEAVFSYLLNCDEFNDEATYKTYTLFYSVGNLTLSLIRQASRAQLMTDTMTKAKH